jgi:hypothetical protein
VTNLLRAAVLACILTYAAPAAVAQTTSIEALLPASIGDFTVDEYYSDDEMPLYSNPFFSGLPTLRAGAAYSSEAGGEVHIGLIIVNELYPGVVGLDNDQAALGLVSFRDATLTPNKGYYEASVETNMDELVMGRAIVARPLGGHAVLIAETFAPESVSTSDLRHLLTSLDLDALGAYARSHSTVNAAVWNFLATMPSVIEGHARAGFHIESDGRRRPLISVNAMYGDAEEPAYAIVASAAGPEITDIADILPFDPSQGLTETSVGEWRALDGVVDGIGGLVVLGDVALVGLFELSGSSSPEDRLATIEGLDLDRVFAAASGYRGSAEAAPSFVEHENGSSEMRLVSWAHVLEAELVRAIIEIDDERIVFAAGHPQLDEFSMMDILLSHHEEHPFLRRVVLIETRGETVVVETRPASLEEAIAPR